MQYHVLSVDTCHIERVLELGIIKICVPLHKRAVFDVHRIVEILLAVEEWISHYKCKW